VPFWNESKKAWESLGQHAPNINTSFGGPTDTDAQKQIDEINTLSSAHLSGLVLAPADSKALVPTVNALTEKQIPVVTFLNDAPGSKRLTYITSELIAGGEKIGEFVAKKLQGKGNVLISYGQAGSDEQESRARGIRQALSRYPGIKVEATFEDKFDDAVGAEQAKTLISKNRDVSAIVGCNSKSASGAVVALKELGYKPGQVTVTGWDYDESLLNLVQQGWVQGSVAQNSEFEAYLAFSILQAQNQGVFSSINAKRSIVPDTIVIPVQVITAEDVSHFRR
jgi:ABC-type sugar transport system substrate-binding protein